MCVKTRADKQLASMDAMFSLMTSFSGSFNYSERSLFCAWLLMVILFAFLESRGELSPFRSFWLARSVLEACPTGPTKPPP